MYPSEIVWSELLLRIKARPGTCLQIGAHDGKTNDPVYALLNESDWVGIFVEPVPQFFEKLIANYSNGDRFIFLNCAIVPTEGQSSLPFYTVKPLLNPPTYWYGGLSSLDKSVIIKHKHSIPEIESLILEIQVKTCTISNLMDHYRIRNIDLAVIDTEGFDGMVIRSFPFERTMPRIILYENKHLSSNDAQQTLTYLMQLGYGVLRLGDNNCAIGQDVMGYEELRLLRQLVKD